MVSCPLPYPPYLGKRTSPTHAPTPLPLSLVSSPPGQISCRVKSVIGVATLNSLDRSQPAAPAAPPPFRSRSKPISCRRYILVPPKSLSGEGGRKQNGQISGLNYVFTLEDLDKLQVSTTAEGHEHHYDWTPASVRDQLPSTNMAQE